MIQIYYQDGSSQVIRPSNYFKPDQQSIKDLVASVAGIYPVKYYVSDFKQR
jgi:hypothetical protein